MDARSPARKLPVAGAGPELPFDCLSSLKSALTAAKALLCDVNLAKAGDDAVTRLSAAIALQEALAAAIRAQYVTVGDGCVVLSSCSCELRCCVHSGYSCFPAAMRTMTNTTS